MAGGMVLLGVLLIYFDVATGMVLFSIIQLATNGWRALHWRHFVLWPIFYGYVGGALIAFAVMRYLAYVPDKAVVYILLGLMPFSVDAAAAIDAAEHRVARHSVLHRHLHHGAAVPGRRSAGCSSISSSTAASSTARPPTPPRRSPRPSAMCCARPISARSPASAICKVEHWGPGIALALLGAVLAPYVLERMTDHGFRQWTRVIIYTLAVVYLVRGGLLLWQGA